MKKIGTTIKQNDSFLKREDYYRELVRLMNAQKEKIKLGGGKEALKIQNDKGKMTARQRIEALVDKDTRYYEIGNLAASDMYEEFGGAPAAGSIVVIGKVSGRDCIIMANDATVKAGGLVPDDCQEEPAGAGNQY